MGVRVVSVSRERDEQLLEWLHCNDEGESCGSIARRYGVGPGSVSRVLKKIRQDDAEAHGEVKK